ncbi:hypothetical protein [Kitasatospora phosalacinea]|uniref:Uncharacterized protein n=1 Tax=Kitasatospora phosalacinea TaxID=2065 RepID=A0ABW6GLR2_9ACTN
MALASAPASRPRRLPAAPEPAPLPVWLVTVPTLSAATPAAVPAVAAADAADAGSRVGVQVFAVRAGTAWDAIALAGGRSAAPSAVLRRRGAVADLARATAVPAAGAFPA